MSAWTWLDERDALALHDRLLLLHGGGAGLRDVGLRDVGLLASALARPRQREAYGEDVKVTELAAAYTAGIAQNQPFVDGDERTGFVIGVLFLELNGARFIASEAAATKAVMGLAAGTLDEAGYAAFLRESTEIQ